MTTRASGPAALFDSVVLAHPRTVLLCLAVLIALLGYQARHFRLDASAATLVLENDEDLRYAREVASRYGGSDVVVVTYSPKGDLFSDVGKFPQMLAKGKISLLPKRSGAAKQMRDVFRRAEEEEKKR